MRSCAVALLAAPMLLAPGGQADASALQVTPVRIQVMAPSAAATITVSNPGDTEIAAQMRVFKWTRVNGKDVLEPTREVVASPPLTKLAPGQPYVVRIVRTDPRPVMGEETYRLLVDEIPNPQSVAPSFGPRFAVRQSIPVYFTDPTAIPRLSWDAKIVKGRLIVTARNDGGKRVRISALSIKDASGRSLKFGDGFIGYAFAGSSEGWVSPSLPKGFAPDGTITISAESDNGPIKAAAKIHAGG